MNDVGYFDYLKGLLEPTGLYNFESGAGKAELEVIGDKLDEIFSGLEELGDECLPITAASYGISLYEKLLPYRPAYITAEDARQALMALLRIRGGCFTRERLQDTLAGCGLTAVVRESEMAQTVIVSFPKNRGIPADFEKLKRRVEEIMPCHLAVEYEFIYTLWRELTKWLSIWRSIEAKDLTWGELEIYMESEN